MPTRPGRAGLLISAFAGTFIALLDVSIVTVALPAMQTELHADVSGVQWIVDAFTVCLASFMLSGGALGDRYGRKRVFLAGLTVFLLGSLVCALATTLPMLVAGRAAQGIAAALVLPGALSIIAQAEPDPARRAKLLGYWGMCASSAVLAGPVLGGVLVDALGWPAIFFVNLPIGAVAIALGLRMIPESSDPQHAALDPLGQLLGIAALGTLSYAIIDTRADGWGSPSTLGLLAVAVVLIAGFIAVELRGEKSMLPMRLFGDARFSTVNLASLLFGFGANGAFVLISLYLQQAQQHSASATGLLLLPMTVAIMPASLVAGRLTARYGPRPSMVIGYTITGLSLLGLISLSPGQPYAVTAVLLLLNGIGQGLAIAPASAAVLQLVPRQRSGIASATVNTARQTGAALGIAVLGTVLGQALAGPGGFADRYTDGMRASMIVAGVAVLVAALLLGVVRGKVKTEAPAVTVAPVHR
jgi:EmrB/QacA subfamily drug resistance transporter